MRNKDQILLENLYDYIYEAKVVMPNHRELIGKKVQLHPAIQGTPESDPDRYMSWSMKTFGYENGKPKWKVVHNARTLLLYPKYTPRLKGHVYKINIKIKV